MEAVTFLSQTYKLIQSIVFLSQSLHCLFLASLSDYQYFSSLHSGF
ncbi:hypothetical protein SOVF_120690 [Spinacia oleracea]|nr:hypothetical protein SOVF_120690 [Spinacia oleracea]